MNRRKAMLGLGLGILVGTAPFHAYAGEAGENRGGG